VTRVTQTDRRTHRDVVTRGVDFAQLAYVIEDVAERFPRATEIKPLLISAHPETDLLVEVRRGSTVEIVLP